jgi:hypothetical protein
VEKRPEKPKIWIDFGAFQRGSACFETVSTCFAAISSLEVGAQVGWAQSFTE